MGKSIVFVDSRVAGFQSLIDGLNEPMDVFVLDASLDGMSQIAAHLLGRGEIDTLHIILHGSEGTLYLVSTVLNSGNLSTYNSQFAAIGSALTEAGDILLYGCSVAQGSIGHAFIDQIAQFTRADLAASTDLTGVSELGGNWALEFATGTIGSATFDRRDD